LVAAAAAARAECPPYTSVSSDAAARLEGFGDLLQTRPVALAAERRKPPNRGHPLERHVQQPLSGSRRSVPSASMNSTSTAAAAPAGCRPMAEPAPATTKHLTTDLESPGAST
jgi:hypothetical protein